jgi:DNA-binding NarL/FixJ family response regulator
MVAEAVIAGETNRQIADELYVSIKTVEFHLSQILTRLGVDSRSDIEGALHA